MKNSGNEIFIWDTFYENYMSVDPVYFFHDFATYFKFLLDVQSALSFTAKILFGGEAALSFFSIPIYGEFSSFGNHALNCAITHAPIFTAVWRRVQWGSAQGRLAGITGGAARFPPALSNFYLPADSPFKPKSIGACSDLISIPKREPYLPHREKILLRRTLKHISSVCVKLPSLSLHLPPRIRMSNEKLIFIIFPFQTDFNRRTNVKLPR